VFRLPTALGRIAYQNKAIVYGLLLKAAAEALTVIAADPRPGPAISFSIPKMKSPENEKVVTARRAAADDFVFDPENEKVVTASPRRDRRFRFRSRK
jgi:hypothetical protein